MEKIQNVLTISESRKIRILNPEYRTNFFMLEF